VSSSSNFTRAAFRTRKASFRQSHRPQLLEDLHPEFVLKIKRKIQSLLKLNIHCDRLIARASKQSKGQSILLVNPKLLAKTFQEHLMIIPATKRKV
jgi:hypothetical protein